MPAGKNPRRLPPETIAKLDDGDWLREQYLNEHNNADEIGALIGVTARTVLTRLAKHRIPRRQIVGQRRDPAKTAKLADGDSLRQRYVTEGQSTTLIAAELHIDGKPYATRFVLMASRFGRVR